MPKEKEVKWRKGKEDFSSVRPVITDEERRAQKQSDLAIAIEQFRLIQYIDPLSFHDAF